MSTDFLAVVLSKSEREVTVLFHTFPVSRRSGLALARFSLFRQVACPAQERRFTGKLLHSKDSLHQDTVSKNNRVGQYNIHCIIRISEYRKMYRKIFQTRHQENNVWGTLHCEPPLGRS